MVFHFQFWFLMVQRVEARRLVVGRWLVVQVMAPDWFKHWVRCQMKVFMTSWLIDWHR